eukprot:9350037-Alexandrium_andersonii.AAC.1
MVVIVVMVVLKASPTTKEATSRLTPITLFGSRGGSEIQTPRYAVQTSSPGQGLFSGVLRTTRLHT